MSDERLIATLMSRIDRLERQIADLRGLSMTTDAVAGSGTAGRVAQWATGGQSIETATLAKTGAGVVTIDAAGAFTLTLAENTYTPTYVGGTTAGVTTYTGQTGSYVRFGRAVIAWISISWSAATGTGEARISLPLAAASDASLYPGSIRYSGVTWTGADPELVINAGNSYLRMQGVSSDAGATITNIEAGGAFVACVVYPTT